MIYVRNCVVCGKEFATDHKQVLSCSEECKYQRKLQTIKSYTKAKRERDRYEEAHKDKICAYCGKVFNSVKTNKIYCSPYCGKCAHTEKIKDIMPKEVPKPKPSKSITQICKEAKEHGMSYGDYIAFLETGVKSVESHSHARSNDDIMSQVM